MVAIEDLAKNNGRKRERSDLNRGVEDDEQVDLSRGSHATSHLFTYIDEDYGDSRSSILSFLFNTFFALVYGYSIYYHHYDPRGSLFNKMLEYQLQPFGLFKFLTYNSLLWQFISAILHLLAQIINKYKKLRDIVFLTFAYPVGCHVVCTFWVVYWTQGRDSIYPISIEPYYPAWLNHVTHSIIVPANIGQAYLTFHRPIKNGMVVSISFLLIYFAFILYIRFNSGMFPYPYMNQMCFVSLIVYIGSMFFCSLAFYQTGCFLTAIFHPKKLN